MQEYDLIFNLVKPTNGRLYAERVIHGEIYKARPDVMAVGASPCAGDDAVPASTGAAFCRSSICADLGGESSPFWDQYDEFGETTTVCW